MEFETLIASITPDIYERLKRAVELGKWEGGVKLTDSQREQCMQAVIAYDERFRDETDRVGYIEQTPHSSCGEQDKDEWQKLEIKE